MPSSKLFTPATIDRLKPGEQVRDSGTPGLLAECNKRGSRSYRYLRKIPATGTVLKRTLGATTDFSLFEAREWAAGLNRTIALGLNPVEEEAKAAAVSEAEAARLAMTVRVAFSHQLEWLEGQRDAGHMAKHTIKMKECRMRKDILPAIGNKALTDVEHDDLWEIIETVSRSGRASASNHLVHDLKSFFKWCMTHGRTVTGLKRNPSLDIIKLNKDKSRDRYFDIWELRAFLRALAHEPDEPTRRIMRLLICSGQRLDNVLHAEKADWQEGAWIIRARDTKTRIPYVLPLGPWGADLFTGSGRWVFPSVRGDGPRLGHIRVMVTWITEGMQRYAPPGRTVEPWTCHDFRRTIRTHMERLRIAERVAEAVIGHADSGIRSVYMMYRYQDEKRDAFARWEAELTRLAIEEGVAETLGLVAPALAQAA